MILLGYIFVLAILLFCVSLDPRIAWLSVLLFWVLVGWGVLEWVV